MALTLDPHRVGTRVLGVPLHSMLRQPGSGRDRGGRMPRRASDRTRRGLARPDVHANGRQQAVKAAA